jgi:cytochrome b6-f complex iron-sulfur subunit
MSSPTVTRGKAVSAQTKAAEVVPAEAAAPAAKPINRREFLYYIWGASIAVLLAQTTGGTIWFLLPRFREGEFGGIFPIDVANVPAVGGEPVANPTGKFWLSNTEDGLVVLSMVCTHLGCLFKWVGSNNRFECPCHGSKFQPDGTYIEGPAPRSLDRFAFNVVTAGGVTPSADGGAVKLDGATRVEVNTGRKVKVQGQA